jgi:hypothetical protein
MLFLFLFAWCVIFGLSPSLQSKRKSEEVWDDMVPSPKKAHIYEWGKSRILFLVREKKNILGYNPVFYDLLRDLGTSELLKAMTADDESNIFLLVFWLGIRQRYNYKFFCKIHFKLAPASRTSTTRNIFKNFKAFLFEAFSESKRFSFNDPVNSLKDYKLLDTFKYFWYNRLEQLGRRYLSSEEYKKQSKSIEKRFRFLSAFLDCGAQTMLIREYRRVLIAIHLQRSGRSSSVKNFRFLVLHFGIVMRAIMMDEFSEMFEWLATQDPKFFLLFAFFNGMGETLWPFQINILNASRFEGMQYAVPSLICWRNGTLNIFGRALHKFGTDCYDSFDRIEWLAKRVIRSTDRWIQEISQN